MDKVDKFQEIYRKFNEFGWWDMERIQTGNGTQFTFKEFQEGLYAHVVWLVLAALDNKEKSVQIEVTW